MHYFGQWWDAPAYDDAVRVDAPVGQSCLLCAEPITADDSGNLTAAYTQDRGAFTAAQHLECWLRQGLGSLEHLTGRCTCTGGVGDEPHGSPREQARAVKAHVLERRRTGQTLLGG